MAKICVVSTDDSSQSELKSVLSENGHEVKTLETSNLSDVEVVVLDIGILGASEMLAGILKAKHTFSNIPLLVVVDEKATSRAVDALRMGADHYVLKSSLKSDLPAFVNLAVSTRQGTSIETLFQDYPTLQELEKRYMKIVLEKTMGRKERAAKILGINRRTLYRKEREYGWVSADSEEDAENGNHNGD